MDVCPGLSGMLGAPMAVVVFFMFVLSLCLSFCLSFLFVLWARARGTCLELLSCNLVEFVPMLFSFIPMVLSSLSLVDRSAAPAGMIVFPSGSWCLLASPRLAVRPPLVSCPPPPPYPPACCNSHSWPPSTLI